MKRILCLLLGVVLLVSCGKEDDVTPSNPSSSSHNPVKLSFDVGMKGSKVACYGMSSNALLCGWHRNDSLGVISKNDPSISLFTCDDDEYAIPAPTQLPGVGQLYKRMVFSGLHGEDMPYYCFYPTKGTTLSDSANLIVSGFNIPNSQYAYKGSYQQDAAILYGESGIINGRYDVVMNNACALFAIKFSYADGMALSKKISRCHFEFSGEKKAVGPCSLNVKTGELITESGVDAENNKIPCIYAFRPKTTSKDTIFEDGYYFFVMAPGKYTTLDLKVFGKAGQYTSYGRGNENEGYEFQAGKMYLIRVIGSASTDGHVSYNIIFGRGGQDTTSDTEGSSDSSES